MNMKLVRHVEVVTIMAIYMLTRADTMSTYMFAVPGNCFSILAADGHTHVNISSKQSYSFNLRQNHLWVNKNCNFSYNLQVTTITTDNPVIVNGMSDRRRRNYQVLPSHLLENVYTVVTYSPVENTKWYNILILSNQSQTITVVFRNRRPTSCFEHGSPSLRTSVSIGFRRFYNVTSLELFQLTCEGDITGSEVRGEDVLALFSGYSTPWRDIWCTQVPPPHNLGFSYILPPLPVITNSSVRIVAVRKRGDESTTITYRAYGGHNRTVRISAGDFFNLNVTGKKFVVLSDKLPLIVMLSGALRSNTTLHYFTMLLPSVGQFSRQVVVKPVRGKHNNYGAAIIERHQENSKGANDLAAKYTIIPLDTLNINDTLERGTGERLVYVTYGVDKRWGGCAYATAQVNYMQLQNTTPIFTSAETPKAIPIAAAATTNTSTSAATTAMSTSAATTTMSTTTTTKAASTAATTAMPTSTAGTSIPTSTAATTTMSTSAATTTMSTTTATRMSASTAATTMLTSTAATKSMSASTSATTTTGATTTMPRPAAATTLSTSTTTTKSASTAATTMSASTAARTIPTSTAATTALPTSTSATTTMPTSTSAMLSTAATTMSTPAGSEKATTSNILVAAATSVTTGLQRTPSTSSSITTMAQQIATNETIHTQEGTSAPSKVTPIYASVSAAIVLLAILLGVAKLIGHVRVSKRKTEVTNPSGDSSTLIEMTSISKTGSDPVVTNSKTDFGTKSSNTSTVRSSGSDDLEHDGSSSADSNNSGSLTSSIIKTVSQ